MASVRSKILHPIGKQLIKYVYKNPEKNMLKLIHLGKRVTGNMFPESTFTKPIEIISDKNNIWHDFLFNGLRDIHPDIFTKAALTQLTQVLTAHLPCGKREMSFTATFRG